MNLACSFCSFHDVPLGPWGIGPYLQGAAPVWNAWNTFDVDNAVLYPYWKPNPFVAIDSGDISVTCHRHEKNGLLVVGVNLGKNTRTATVRANLNLLHISPTKVVVIDVYRDEPTGMRMFWIR